MGIKKSLKSLIFEDEQVSKEEPKFTSKFSDAGAMANTFPSSSQTPFMENSTMVSPPVPTLNVPLECAPHMESIMKKYENGFASLNRPGIEFYEFFEAVVDTGINDPKSYQMALKILSKSEKSMTKESLISQSQYYIDELMKVHANNSAVGIKMKEDLMADKNSEGNKLRNDIQLLKDQIESIKNQLLAKESQLSQIDARYQPKINDFDCKIMANDEAKNRILGTINAVVNGIKSNL